MLQDVLRDANDESKPLDSVLRTAMIFAYSIDYQPLIEWVNAELDGYLDNENLPDYRSFKSQIYANFTNGYWQSNRQLVSEYAFQEDWRDAVKTVQLMKGVRTLESNVGQTDIVQHLPDFIIHHLSTKAESGYHCTSVWLDVPLGSVEQVLSAVRTRLLRFCLTIQREFPHVGTAEPTAESASVPTPAVAYYFNTIVMGENASVALGDVDIVGQVNNVRLGDFDSLRDALSRNGVAGTDIESLHHMIDSLTAGDVETDSATVGRLKAWSADAARKMGRNVGGDVRGIIVEMLLRMIFAYFGIPAPFV